MSSPVGISDLLALAQTSYYIHRYWKGVPDDLKDLLQKFDHIGKQLELLNAVIVSSVWSPYNRTSDLRSLFTDTEAFFVKHNALLQQSTTGASKLGKLDEDEMKRIEKRVDEEMKMMQDFKTNIMFLASVRTLQGSRTMLQRRGGDTRASRQSVGSSNVQVTPTMTTTMPAGRTQQLIEEARTDSDVLSVISEATTALQFATKLKRSTVPPYQPNLETVIASSPEVIALASSTDRDLIETFLDQSQQLVEELQLYTNEATPAKHVDDLAEFVAKANKLTHDLRPSKAGMSAEVRCLRLPTIEPSPHSFSDSFLRSPEFQRWASADSQWIPVPSQDQVSLVLGQPAGSVTQSASTQTDSDAVFSMRSLSFSEDVEVGGPAKEHIGLSGWVRIYAGKQTDSQKISCELDITRSEGSICICAVATSRRRPSSILEAAIMPVAMTPGKLMHGHEMNIASDNEGPFRTFQHSFTNIDRPVPHVLHPSVEGPTAKENYSISFHDPQYFVEEGCPPKWTRELKYVFVNEIDRNIVRSKIFGKKLLRSAGTEKISFNYIACLQHAITLWEDEATHIKTITFYRDPPNNKSRPAGDVEYKFLGITDLKKAEKDGEPLPLNVEQISQDPTPVSPTSRQSSSLTSSLIKSGKARSRDDMSCSIYFSEARDKKAFLQILRPRAPG
jgi:hypothetical protein